MRAQSQWLLLVWPVGCIVLVLAVGGPSKASAALVAQAESRDSMYPVDPIEAQESMLAPRETATSQTVVPGPRIKCTRQSTTLARQTLVSELDSINRFGPGSWLFDLDKDEMLEAQKLSLASMLLAGEHMDDPLEGLARPMLELEASYFRSTASVPAALAQQQQQQQQRPVTMASVEEQAASIKPMRQHANRCHLAPDKSYFLYTFGLTLGPITHHLDVLYNYPRELRLSQPNERSYAQLIVQVPKMHYEISLTQVANHKLNEGCAIEVRDVTYLARNGGNGPMDGAGGAQQVSISGHGLAANNQTALHAARLFNDYTRPIVSRRLRQLLKLTLTGKTFPLASIVDT